MKISGDSVSKPANCICDYEDGLHRRHCAENLKLCTTAGCESGGEMWPKPTAIPVHDLPSSDLYTDANDLAIEITKLLQPKEFGRWKWQVEGVLRRYLVPE